MNKMKKMVLSIVVFLATVSVSADEFQKKIILTHIVQVQFGYINLDYLLENYLSDENNIVYAQPDTVCYMIGSLSAKTHSIYNILKVQQQIKDNTDIFDTEDSDLAHEISKLNERLEDFCVGLNYEPRTVLEKSEYIKLRTVLKSTEEKFNNEIVPQLE